MPRMLCIGAGPGPKNVLVEYDDGSKGVVPYAIWKYKLRRSVMPETKKYVTAVGFVQFDPQERDANGKQVTDLVIKTPGGDAKQLRITVWPEILVEKSLGRKVEKGDFLAVDGGFSSSTYQDKEGKQRTSLQISAYQLNINGVRIERQEREVVTSDSASSGSEDTF